MSFWSKGKDTKKLVELRKKLQEAIMDNNTELEERLRQQIKALQSKDKSSSKGKSGGPMASKKSLVTKSVG